MKKLKIAFDIDGTCVNIMKDVSTHLFDLTNIDVSETDRYDLTTHGISKNIVMKAIIKAYKQYNNTEIHDGVEELISKLWEKSRESIQFITARDSKYCTYTYKLIDRFCKVPYRIDFTNNKLEYLKHYAYFAEDKRSLAKELASAGKIIFLPDRTWNRMDPDPYNVVRLQNGLSELLSLIDLLVKGGR